MRRCPDSDAHQAISIPRSIHVPALKVLEDELPKERRVCDLATTRTR